MDDVECPYCGKWQEVNNDDGFGCSEDVTEEMECDKCEKNFVFTTSISYHYDSSKADCLNGAEHKYEKTHTYPKFMTKWRCKDCEHEKPLDADDPLLQEGRSDYTRLS